MTCLYPTADRQDRLGGRQARQIHTHQTSYIHYCFGMTSVVVTEVIVFLSDCVSGMSSLAYTLLSPQWKKTGVTSRLPEPRVVPNFTTGEHQTRFFCFLLQCLLFSTLSALYCPCACFLLNTHIFYIYVNFVCTV